jgi:hypothetical protein
MDSTRTALGADELDLTDFPTQKGRSLLDVVGAHLRKRLATITVRDSNQPLVVVIALGAVIGTGLGLILI